MSWTLDPEIVSIASFNCVAKVMIRGKAKLSDWSKTISFHGDSSWKPRLRINPLARR